MQPHDDPVVRRDDGGLRLRLAEPEAALLAAVPATVGPALDGREPDADARPAPGVDGLDAEMHRLADEEVRAARHGALERVVACLRRGELHGEVWHLDLDGEEAGTLATVVHDARRVLAARVGIRDESDWERGPDPGDADSVLLWFLGWLLEEIVSAVADDAGQG